MQPSGGSQSSFQVRFPGAREFLAEWERSLSKGGLFVDTTSPAAFGTTVRVALELPNEGGTIPILGQVAFVIQPNAPQSKRPGMGVRFRLDPQAEQAVHAFVHRLSRGSNAGRILVVDDDALILAQITDVLAGNGFQVKTAANAIKALDVLKFESFDAILSDLNMPRMDGFELRDNLQREAKTRDVPFILITSTTDDETRATAKRLGAKAFVAKPIAPDPLLSVVRAAVAEYSATATSGRRDEKKSATSAVRDRRIVEIAFRKMKALGMDVRFTADESGVAARVVFRSASLVNAFTRQRITEARVRNIGHDKVRFMLPPHLASLPDIPILDLADAAAFERAVATAYAQRAESQVRAKQLFDKFRLPTELDEPGFRIVSRVKIDRDEITFSVVDAKTILLESLNGRHFGPVMGEGARRIDIADATSGIDVELELATVLREYRGELERLVKEAEARAVAEKKLWLEEQPAELTAAPRGGSASSGPASAPPERAMFAKPGEFRLDADDAPPAPFAATPPPAPPTVEPEPADLDVSALEPVPPEPVPQELDLVNAEPLEEEPAPEPVAPIAPIAEPAPPPPAAGDMALVCSTCGSTYSLGDEVEDERLLMHCPTCIAAGNAR